MKTAFDISISALRSALKKVDVTSSNVANINTDGYKKYRSTFVESRNGGVDIKIEKTTTPGPVRTTSEGELREASNVEYPEEMVELILARHMISTNLAVIETTDEMIKRAIEVLGK